MPNPANPPLCLDCEHRITLHSNGSPHAALNGPVYFCGRHSPVCNVTGLRSAKGCSLCEAERGENGSCGLAARHFKRRAPGPHAGLLDRLIYRIFGR